MIDSVPKSFAYRRLTTANRKAIPFTAINSNNHGEQEKTMKHAPRTRRLGGFSLVELMVVISIIGILVAIAMPSYNAYRIKANRALAQSFLLSIVNKEEQFRLDNRAYTNTIAASGLGLTEPSELSGLYTFGITGTAVGASATLISDFAATATAVGGQVSDGDLTIDNLGTKTGHW